MAELPPLRDYQRRGVEDIRAAAVELAHQSGPLADRHGYGILVVAPTGAGKTRVGLELTTSASRKGGRGLWIAPRNELVEQPVRRMRELGFNDIRTIYDGHDEGDPGASMIVASIQTLLARGLTPPADVVVLDEARHYVAAKWGEIAGAYTSSVRIGLDATPGRADGRPMGDLFDRIVALSSVRELTELGWLVPARFIGPATHGKALSATALEAWQQDANGKRSLVFCANQIEAKECARRFRDAGIRAEAVDAHTPLDERRAALQRVRSGQTLVLVNVMLFTEGLDLVELESIIIARGVSHPSTWLQIGGRGLRPSPHTNKTECVISDLFGHFHRRDFGPLDDPRIWSLEGKPIETAEGLLPIVQCKRCHGWERSGRACPRCGAVLPKAKPPKLSKRARAELRHQKALKNRKGPRWEAYRELVLTQRANGYKPQWVAFKFKGRFRHFPPWRTGDVA